jgi:peptidoglycan/LPS O-acetylase OafA/YrhL
MTAPSPALGAQLRSVTPVHTREANPLSVVSARDASFDYLRAFIVLLVVLHHSVLAYAVLWPAQPETFEILPAPIVDPQRWAGFDILAGFNDTFFMALMFLLSGLFVWPSLERKGGARFLRDRILRLGLPFAIAAGILMPLGYYPSYVVTGADPGFAAYARAWLSLGFWPSGPAWFISLLLVFDAVAAVLYMLWRRWTASRQVPQYLRAYGRLPAFFALLLAVSALVYVPMELTFGESRWLAVGPFLFQASRPLLYATYFLAGIHIGASGIKSGLFADNARLVRRWPIWLLAGLAAYVLRLAVIVTLGLPVVGDPLTLRLLNDFTLILCSGTISLAFIALFRRFAVGRQPVFDNLSASSYGIYLVHYPVVIWLQFTLLPVALSPMTKGAIVFASAVAMSWGIVVALRRVPAIARVL